MFLMVTGCSFGPGKVRTETLYQEVKVPVSNVPMPPNTDCPPLRTVTVDDISAMSDGEVAKAYRIAIEQSTDCSDLRQMVIDKYREMAAEDRRKVDDLERQAMAAPASSAGPTADNANKIVINAPTIVELDGAEIRLQEKREEEFGNFEAEFESLKRKDYDIE
jgi:hypothetical protein